MQFADEAPGTLLNYIGTFYSDEISCAKVASRFVPLISINDSAIRDEFALL